MPSGETVESAYLLGFLLDRAHERRAYFLHAPPELGLDHHQRESLHLANALLQAEDEIAERRWLALERLLALIPPGGELNDVLYLPAPLMARAVRLAMECGWYWSADE